MEGNKRGVRDVFPSTRQSEEKRATRRSARLDAAKFTVIQHKPSLKCFVVVDKEVAPTITVTYEQYTLIVSKSSP